MTSRRLACLFTCALVASGPAAAQEGATRNDRPLTLTEASELALAHNLDIAVERVNVPAADLEISSLKAAYLPTLNGLAGDLQQTSVPVTLLNGGPQVKTNTATFNAALTENVPWGGGASSTTTTPRSIRRCRSSTRSRCGGVSTRMRFASSCS